MMAKTWGSVLGILLSFLLGAATAHFLHPSTSEVSSRGAALASLSLFSFPILLALFFHGPLLGSAFFAVASLNCLFFSLREGDPQLLGPLPAIGAAFGVSWWVYRRMRDRGSAK